MQPYDNAQDKRKEKNKKKKTRECEIKSDFYVQQKQLWFLLFVFLLL